MSTNRVVPTSLDHGDTQGRTRSVTAGCGRGLGGGSGFPRTMPSNGSHKAGSVETSNGGNGGSDNGGDGDGGKMGRCDPVQAPGSRQPPQRPPQQDLQQPPLQPSPPLPDQPEQQVPQKTQQHPPSGGGGDGGRGGRGAGGGGAGRMGRDGGRMGGAAPLLAAGMPQQAQQPILENPKLSLRAAAALSSPQLSDTASQQCLMAGGTAMVARTVEESAHGELPPAGSQAPTPLKALPLPQPKQPQGIISSLTNATAASGTVNGSTALMEAATEGQLEVVKLLLEMGADVNAREKDGWTALIRAVTRGHLEVVKLLLEMGADVNARAQYLFQVGRTALMMAADGGHFEVVKLLLEMGADVNARTDEVGRTALMMAADGGHLEVVKLLLEMGADVNARTKGGSSALIMAADGGHLEVVKLLLETGGDVNARTEGGCTALIEAASKGHFEVVKLVLEMGADVNARTEGGSSALIEAANGGHLEVVKLVLEMGADVNAQAEDKRTALIEAAYNGHLEVVKLVLEMGADVNAQPEYPFQDEWTALMMAAYEGHLEVVKLLLEMGADVNSRAKGGSTVLIEAASKGHLEVVKLVLEIGADVNARDEGGWTALCRAADNEHMEVVKLLLERGADVNARDEDGDTALMNAACKGHLQLAKLLLKMGADINAHNKIGISPVLHAVIHGELIVADHLLHHGAESEALTNIPTSAADVEHKPQSARLFQQLCNSATHGPIKLICRDIPRIPRPSSPITTATTRTNVFRTCSDNGRLQKIVSDRPDLLLFLFRVMLAADQELYCLLLLEWLSWIIMEKWRTHGLHWRFDDECDDYPGPFTRLIRELEQRSPRLLAQLILGAHVTLLEPDDFRCSLTSHQFESYVLQTPTAIAQPLIAQHGSSIGRSFLPTTITIKKMMTGDDPLHPLDPLRLEEQGRITLQSVPMVLMEAVQTCVMVGLSRQRLTWSTWSGLLRCWMLVADVAASRGPCITTHWYASASLALVHLGPTGLMAATTMGFGWLVALVVLQPLLLAVLLPCRALATAADAVARAGRAVRGQWQTSEAPDAELPSGVIGVSNFGRQYTVSVSEVRLPRASMLLSPRSLAGLLSDPRVDSRLWTCPAFNIIMELRWLRFTRHVVAGMFFIRLAHLAVFLTYVLNFPADIDAEVGPSALQQGCMGVLALMTAEHAMVEVRQVAALGLADWLVQPWNLSDGAQIGLMTATLALHWSCAVPLHVVRCLAALLVLVLFWRLFGYAIAVPGLGSLVRMVLEVSLDLRWFFVFLGASMIGFGLALQVLGLDIAAGETAEAEGGGGGVSAWRLFARLYSMIFGDFNAALLLDLDGEGGKPRSLATLTAIICCIYMLFVAVVLFNLLIAVIGDAYERVGQHSATHLARSKAALVVESELLLPDWFVAKRDEALLKCFGLLILQKERVADEEDDTVNSGTYHVSDSVGVVGGTQPHEWRGRLGEMQAMLANTEKALVRELKTELGKQVKELQAELNKQRRELRELVKDRAGQQRDKAHDAVAGLASTSSSSFAPSTSPSIVAED